MTNMHNPGTFGRKRLGPVARFLGIWAGLFGFIAAGGGSTCPCCGTPGCPVAPVAAGVLGGIVTVLLYIPRWLMKALHAWRRQLPAGNDTAKIAAE